MNSVYLKRLSEAKPSFEILRFDIRYSAVRCSVRVKFQLRCRVLGKRDVRYLNPTPDTYINYQRVATPQRPVFPSLVSQRTQRLSG